MGKFFLYFLQPVSSSKTILLSPYTIKYYASFIHSTATINDLTIQFSSGNQFEELLRVPIAAPGELPPTSLICITVGTNPPAADNDPTVGITDSANSNQFYLIEDGRSLSGNHNPCQIKNGSLNGKTGPLGNPAAGGYTLLFDPAHQYGSCTTNNGFAANGKFNSQVDASKGLSLVVHRNDAGEQYVFYYFLIEFL